MQKPTGVVILAILAWAGAALCLIPGLALLLGSTFLAGIIGNQFGPIAAFAGVIGGAFCLFFALIAAVVGWGLWTLQEWARVVTIIFQGIGLVFGILSLFVFLHPFGVVFKLVRIAISGVIIWYLMQPHVVVAFRRPVVAQVR
ncbi:MAG TPA: hypothetical protein VKW78_11000 [Terriglobales bacterium]|jgi:hypothetical protein|nr:hypothetical protein [Terriglobales bacterium]